MKLILFIFSVSLFSGFSVFSEESESPSPHSFDSREIETMKKHVYLAEEGVNRMESFVHLCRESVNSYIPLKVDNGVQYSTSWDSKEVKEALKNYRGLYLSYSEEMGLCNRVLIKEDMVYFIHPVYGENLNCRKLNTLEEYSEYCREIFEDLFALPANKKGKIIRLSNKIGELAPSLESREELFRVNPRIFYPSNLRDNFEIRRKKIPSALSERLHGLLTAFRQFGERGTKSWSKDLFGDVERELALFSACDPELAEKGYRFYGVEGEIFGMSLPGGDLLATEHSWPVYLEKLFDALKVYCNASGDVAEEKMKEVLRLCDEIEKRIKENGMDSNPLAV